MSASRPQARLIWGFFVLIFLAGGGLALWLSFQPIVTVQSFGGRLAPDGELEVLTLIPETTLRGALLALGTLLLSAALAMAAAPKLVRKLAHNGITAIRSFTGNLPADTKIFFQNLFDWPSNRSDRWILVGIVFVSLLVRLPLLDRPMFHDESYTVLTWAPGPLRYLLEDYHLPNNHIFHTLLVSITYDLLGSQPWSVRLPAFIAGLLLIPAGYGLARRWYGRVTGIIAAGLIGMAPILTDYATNARGYTLFMLFTLLLFWLAARLAHQINRFEWLLLAVFASLGFWTVPMVLYPFGAVCGWLLLAALFDPMVKNAYGNPFRTLKYLLAAGVLTILLTVMMYSPVLVHSGTEQLFENSFIYPLTFDEFWPTLFESRLPETFAEFTFDLGLVGSAVLVIGILLSLVKHRRESGYPYHALWSILLWVIPMLLLRRPNAWARTWSFIYPLALIWAAAGWVNIFSRLKFKLETLHRPHPWLAKGAAVLLMVGVLVVGVRHTLSICPGIPCGRGEEESVVAILMPRLEETDLVLAESPSNVVLWYYFDQYGLSRDHFRQDLPFYRAFILVRPADDQSVETVIHRFNFSDDWFVMNTLTQVFATSQIQLFQVDANKERVNQEYGIK